MPIAYNNKKFSTSLPSAMFTFTFSLTLMLLLSFVEIKALTVYSKASKVLSSELIMASQEILLSFIKTLLIYTSLVFNQKRLASVLNNGIFLINEFSKLLDERDQFADMKLRSHIFGRILIVAVQGIAIISFIAVSTFIHTEVNAWTIIGYTHVPNVLITVTYFIGMIVIGRLHRILYQSLKSSFRIIKKSRNLNVHQINVLSDNIDGVARDYQKVLVFTSRFHSLFGIHIMLTLISCYLVVFNAAS